MAQENEMDVSQLVAPSSSATVHGVFVDQIWRRCNLHHLFHRGLVNNTNKYGSTVIYAVYFTMAWSITRTNMKVL